MTQKKPKNIQYENHLDRYNARHTRARKRGKRWAEKKAHKPKKED